MTAAEALALARAALEDDRRATPGPWAFNGYSGVASVPRLREYDEMERLIPADAPESAWDGLPEPWVANVPVIAGDTGTSQGRIDADVIAAARTREPALARWVERAVPALIACAIPLEVLYACAGDGTLSPAVESAIAEAVKLVRAALLRAVDEAKMAGRR